MMWRDGLRSRPSYATGSDGCVNDVRGSVFTHLSESGRAAPRCGAPATRARDFIRVEEAQRPSPDEQKSLLIS